MEITGWGRGYESWGIRYEKIFGDLEKDETWDRLEEYLDRELYFASGTSLLLACTCIDTGGHFTTQCYKWLKKMERKGKRIHHSTYLQAPAALSWALTVEKKSL